MSSDIETFSWFVEGLPLLLIGLFGVVGNFISIIWFSRKIVQRNFHNLMLFLAIFDLLYVCLSITIFSLPNLFPSIWTNSTYLHMIPILLPLAQIGLSGSIYFTLAIAVERYCAICHPFWKLSHSCSSFCYILPISFLSVAYNIPKFWEHQVVRKTYETNTSSNNVSQVFNGNYQDNSTVYEEIVPTSLRTNPVYVKIYCIHLNLVVHGIIPPLLLMIIYFKIYKKIRQIGQITNDQQPVYGRTQLRGREMKMAQVSCIIVAVFILCHGVRWIPNVYELTRAEKEAVLINWPPWVQYTTCFSHLLTVFSSSVNFYIYFLKIVNRKKRRRFSTELVQVEKYVDNITLSLNPDITVDTSVSV